MSKRSAYKTEYSASANGYVEKNQYVPRRNRERVENIEQIKFAFSTAQIRLFCKKYYESGEYEKISRLTKTLGAIRRAIMQVDQSIKWEKLSIDEEITNELKNIPESEEDKENRYYRKIVLPMKEFDSDVWLYVYIAMIPSMDDEFDITYNIFSVVVDAFMDLLTAEVGIQRDDIKYNMDKEKAVEIEKLKKSDEYSEKKIKDIAGWRRTENRDSCHRPASL